jgi:ACT domain-containing protein
VDIFASLSLKNWYNNKIYDCCKGGPKMTVPKTQQERAIVTVMGMDKVGIIAGVASTLSAHSVNILDISQTILGEFFTMIMIVDLKKSTVSLQMLQDILRDKGEEIGVQINVQHEDIFKFMHRI